MAKTSTTRSKSTATRSAWLKRFSNLESQLAGSPETQCAKIFRMLFLVVLGVVVGIVVYESILFARACCSRKQSFIHLVDRHSASKKQKRKASNRDANRSGCHSIKSRQIFSAQCSPAKTRTFVTHRGFDYEAIQKAFEQAQREARAQAKGEGEKTMTGFQTCLSSSAAAQRSASNSRRTFISHRNDRS